MYRTSTSRRYKSNQQRCTPSRLNIGKQNLALRRKRQAHRLHPKEQITPERIGLPPHSITYNKDPFREISKRFKIFYYKTRGDCLGTALLDLYQTPEPNAFPETIVSSTIKRWPTIETRISGPLYQTRVSSDPRLHAVTLADAEENHTRSCYRVLLEQLRLKRKTSFHRRQAFGKLRERRKRARRRMVNQKVGQFKRDF